MYVIRFTYINTLFVAVSSKRCLGRWRSPFCRSRWLYSSGSIAPYPQYHTWLCIGLGSFRFVAVLTLGYWSQSCVGCGTGYFTNFGYLVYIMSNKELSAGFLTFSNSWCRLVEHCSLKNNTKQESLNLLIDWTLGSWRAKQRQATVILILFLFIKLKQLQLERFECFEWFWSV